MDEQHYPDPFQNAAEHGLHRALQLVTFVGTAAQVYLYHQRAQARITAERDDRARRALQAQIRAERDAARAGWAPALDPQWLRNANLVDTAQAWGAAMPYADRAVPWYEPTAATALRKTEERLRDLHPHAMARYDRLRADGLSPADAMHQAALFFARPTRVYDPPSTPRSPLAPGESTPPRNPSRAARPWERDFPFPITEVVFSAAALPPSGESQASASRPATPLPGTISQPRP